RRQEAPPSLACCLIRRATWDGRLGRLFPMIGVMILAADLLYNLKLSASPGLQREDTIAILAAGVFMVYGFVPPRFSRQRDFVLTEFQRPARRLWLLLGLGMGAAYVANVLRMVIIVLVGYYTDSTETDLQNMLIAHSYAGWLIFLGWIAVFWGALFKFLPVEE